MTASRSTCVRGLEGVGINDGLERIKGVASLQVDPQEYGDDVVLGL